MANKHIKFDYFLQKPRLIDCPVFYVLSAIPKKYNCSASEKKMTCSGNELLQKTFSQTLTLANTLKYPCNSL